MFWIMLFGIWATGVVTGWIIRDNRHEQELAEARRVRDKAEDREIALRATRYEQVVEDD